jgi:transcriptional regulator with XRE-family HTH domain
MGRVARNLFPATQRRAEALGARLRAARLRRRMSEAEMAERAFISRPTLRKLETGDLTVGTAILARVLEVLALEGDLDRIAADDDLGHRLADARTPLPHTRTRRP